MRLDKNGILIYKDLKKNPILRNMLGHVAKFTFEQGAMVEFYSPNPDSICKVEMLEKYSGELHYVTELKNGMFAKSSREEISPLLIKATDETGTILLDIDLEEMTS